MKNSVWPLLNNKQLICKRVVTGRWNHSRTRLLMDSSMPRRRSRRRTRTWWIGRRTSRAPQMRLTRSKIVRAKKRQLRAWLPSNRLRWTVSKWLKQKNRIRTSSDRSPSNCSTLASTTVARQSTRSNRCQSTRRWTPTSTSTTSSTWWESTANHFTLTLTTSSAQSFNTCFSSMTP